MPPLTPEDAGRHYITTMKAKVPALAAQYDAILASPDALTELGRGVLMREDHSRLMNEADTLTKHLKSEEKRFNDWYTTAKEDLELGRTARTAGWKPTDPNNPNPDPSKVTPAGLTAEEVTKLMNDREVGQAQFVTALGKLSFQHFQQFGEVLDTEKLVRELMTDADAGKRGLVKHYEHSFSTQLADARKKSEDANFEKRYQERRALEVRESASRPPYPTGPNDPVSPLDALEPVKGKVDTTVDDAVAEYNRLVAAGASR